MLLFVRSRQIEIVVLIVIVAVAGCCSSEHEVAPSHNRTAMTPDGQFVGHLKPVPPPVGPGGKLVVPDYPVLWVVDGSEVTHTEGAYDVNTFRLDFNEKEPITEATLPFALMTETTNEVIVHRGPPPEPFTNPQINNGEQAFAIYHCENHECPRMQETDNGQLFPVAPGADPVCPRCSKSDAIPFTTVQHREMREFMERQAKP